MNQWFKLSRKPIFQTSLIDSLNRTDEWIIIIWALQFTDFKQATENHDCWDTEILNVEKKKSSSKGHKHDFKSNPSSYLNGEELKSPEMLSPGLPCQISVK